MKKVIFVDRDGTIIAEPEDEQIDSLEKLEFVPGAISGLKSLMGLGYELVMASNQDGLGTESFPEDDFWGPHKKMLKTLEGEGVLFDDFLIDRSFPSDGLDTRKPGIGMFGKYLDGSYDMSSSYVIGDRDTDAQLAMNLGAQSIMIGPDSTWEDAVGKIRLSDRFVEIYRKTSETEIRLSIDLDGSGKTSEIDTGLKFLDHMLMQIVHHGAIALSIKCKGDLEVDEHHTMEDIAIVLGEAIKKALGDKRGIERYGFALPMDESSALVLLDFGGRSELVWNVEFSREYVGDVPTEMFRHFFHSLSSAAGCNLRIDASGENCHHIAEAIFKAFARSLKQSVRRNPFSFDLPSSKGIL